MVPPGWRDHARRTVPWFARGSQRAATCGSTLGSIWPRENAQQALQGLLSLHATNKSVTGSLLRTGRYAALVKSVTGSLLGPRALVRVSPALYNKGRLAARTLESPEVEARKLRASSGRPRSNRSSPPLGHARIARAIRALFWFSGPSGPLSS